MSFFTNIFRQRFRRPPRLPSPGLPELWSPPPPPPPPLSPLSPEPSPEPSPESPELWSPPSPPPRPLLSESSPEPSPLPELPELWSPLPLPPRPLLSESSPEPSPLPELPELWSPLPLPRRPLPTPPMVITMNASTSDDVPPTSQDSETMAIFPAIISSSNNYNYTGPGNSVINNNNVTQVIARDLRADDWEIIEKELVRYHHVPRAVHDAQPAGGGCMEGTRTQLLEVAKNLITSRGGAHIVWIAGMAGTGKTSIALTLCRRLRDDPAVCLGGTFFCSRSAGAIERTDAQRIIPTLATQLARVVPAFLASLATALRKDPDLPHKSIRDQVNQLLGVPLDYLVSFDPPIVFVIDALDECDDQRHLAELVDSLAAFQSAVPVKFLVTSRPDLRIRQSAIANPAISTPLSLDTIDPAQITADIQLYIQMTLRKKSATTAWYTESDVEELARLADGLFVFAAVSTAYILIPTNGSHRSERLRKVKKYQAASALAPLDMMYSLILDQATDPTILEPTELADARKIIAAILSSRMPLSVKTLAEILGISPELLRGALDELHAVVFVPTQDEEGELRTLHATFVDFLFTRAPERIRISETFGHGTLAGSCLRRMADGDLCFNVAGSRSSYEPNPSTKPDCIAQSLRYACMQWAHHAKLASEEFDSHIDSFLRRKFIFWLEALSVIGEIGLASKLLDIVASLDPSSPRSIFLRDAISFVTSSREAIEFNASHVYISAIAFTPEDSLISRTFSPLLEGLVTVKISGIDFHASGEVNAAAMSPDGRAVVVTSGDGSSRVWDAKTREEVYSVPPGDAEDAHVVTISADGRLIATGSSDHTVRLSNASAGQHFILRGHNDRVTAVSFSLESTQLASGSDDQTIRVWGVESGQQLSVMTTASSVSSIAYSQDGQLLAAGYTSRYVHIFHAATGNVERTFRDPREASDINSKGIMSLVFAPSGDFIWVASGNDILGLAFDRKSRPPTATGHTARVNTVASSQCGRFIVSGADDTTVRLWDASTGDPCGPVLYGHAGAVLSVAFTKTNKFVVSASRDGTIRVWNLQKIMSFAEQKEESPLAALATARYQDGWLVSSGSLNQRLLWIPPEHRGHLEIGGHARVIGAHRVIITAEADHLYLGENWNKCWRAGD